jgi:hypothetical protein
MVLGFRGGTSPPIWGLTQGGGTIHWEVELRLAEVEVQSTENIILATIANCLNLINFVEAANIFCAGSTCGEILIPKTLKP